MVLTSLAFILACSIHSFYFAESTVHHCVDVTIIALSTLGIVYADNLAVAICEFFSKTQSAERAPPALE